MSSLDYFTAGFTRALARRDKQQAKQPAQQINSHATESDTEVTPTFSPSAKQFDEEKYRTTITTKMIALIAKHKNITA